MKNGTILIVDDEPINLDLLMKLLDEDYDVHLAGDGEQALEVDSETLPDVILLDISMPGIDGYEVCRRLKRNPRTAAISVIFVTVHGDIDAELRGLEAGGLDYITKPFSAKLVKMRVRNHVELKR